MTSAVTDETSTTRVRHFVREMLGKSESFGKLNPDEQSKMARALVDTLRFLTDENAGVKAEGMSAPAAPPMAAALDDANKALKDRLAQAPTQAGKGFVGGAAAEGSKQFKNLVASVDFPKFVSGLIQNVYVAIVDASIKQMKEYGALLAQVVKSVDQYAKDNVSQGQARNFLMQSFPGQLEMSTGEDGSEQLSLKDTGGDQPAPDFKALLQMQENLELSQENEQKIVLAAQLQMARQQQKQLAVMMAMGINRIVVTDGEIKATVMFDMKSKDSSQKTTTASTYDENNASHQSGGGWFSDPTDVSTSVSSAYSQEDTKSTSDLETKAKLTGSVTVRFKSETFPLERLATGDEVGSVQQKSGAR